MRESAYHIALPVKIEATFRLRVLSHRPDRILASNRYKKFLQGNAESVQSVESMLLRFSPELSNPARRNHASRTGFLAPKHIVAGTAKQKSTGMKASAEKPKQ